MGGSDRLLAAFALFGLGRAATPQQEEIFIQTPNAEAALETLRHYTSIPHVHGSENDFVMANWTHQRMLELGLESRIDAVPVQITWPLGAPSLTMTKQNRSETLKAKLAEDILPEDNTSDTWYRNHTYNAYSVNGNVTGQVVYANYGTDEDFAVLAENKVNVKGAIVMVRYGQPDGRGFWRGLKVWNAQKYGAVGCIIFSDPADDGYKKGKVYPEGPWRPPSGIQRGSILQSQLCSGDPSRSYLKNKNRTTKQVCGLPYEALVPRIPSLPISYEDAEPFLKELEGRGVSPEGFQGGLNLTYHTGPSVFPANLVVNNSLHIGPIWNVITTIPGKMGSEARPIVLGNHRDAWVFGAVDPNSGSAALLEMAKGFAAMLKAGWQPLRTIILASWDGEEPGCLGSTAYAELNEGYLRNLAVAYINVDSAVSGTEFKAEATPSLSQFITDTLGEVLDPKSGLPLSEVWSGKVGPLGSGSDYVAFIDYLGIASMDISFNGPYGVYHSDFDSFDWFQMNCDKRYLAATATIWGLLAIRLADALVLPFSPVATATAAKAYVQELETLGASKHCRMTTLGAVENALTQFTVKAHWIEEQKKLIEEHIWKQLSNGSKVMDIIRLKEVEDLNDRLAFFERRFLGTGLPGHPFFKHTLQAPDLERGYAAQTLPGPSEAVKQGNCDAAEGQLFQLAVRFYEVSTYLQNYAPAPTPAPRPRPLPPSPREHGNPVLGWFVAVLVIGGAFALCLKTVNAREARMNREMRETLVRETGGGGQQLGSAPERVQGH